MEGGNTQKPGEEGRGAGFGVLLAKGRLVFQLGWKESWAASELDGDWRLEKPPARSWSALNACLISWGFVVWELEPSEDLEEERAVLKSGLLETSVG